MKYEPFRREAGQHVNSLFIITATGTDRARPWGLYHRHHDGKAGDFIGRFATLPDAKRHVRTLTEEGPIMTNTEKLDRLIDADLAHLMSMTDAEVLAEAAENGDDPEAVRARVRSAVEAATTRVRCVECNWSGVAAELRGDAGDCPRGCSGTAVSLVA